MWIPIILAQEGMIPPSQVVSYWRWPEGRNRSNNKNLTMELVHHLPYISSWEFIVIDNWPPTYSFFFFCYYSYINLIELVISYNESKALFFKFSIHFQLFSLYWIQSFPDVNLLDGLSFVEDIPNSWKQILPCLAKHILFHITVGMST